MPNTIVNLEEELKKRQQQASPVTGTSPTNAIQAPAFPGATQTKPATQTLNPSQQAAQKAAQQAAQQATQQPAAQQPQQDNSRYEEQIRMLEQQLKQAQQQAQQAKTQQTTQQPTQQPVQQEQTPYTGMPGISATTAERLKTAQAGYQPTAEYLAAQEALQQLQAQKPQGYTSKYSGQLEGILQELQGKKFSYDLNGDAFFQSLKDTQQQLAKQAAMDTMGMAAGLTGGYGNSSAQAVANQAYQQGLMSLNDRAMDAYNLALQRFQIEQQGLGDQFNRLAQMESQEYGRYRDTVGDWERERDYLTGRADRENEIGYERWRDDLDYQTRLAQIENADYRTEQERQEAIRQFNQQYAMQQAQFDRGVYESDRNYDRSVLESDRDYATQQDQIKWQKDVDQRNFDRNVLESDRSYDRGVFESDRNYDRSVLESDRAYELNKAQLEESIRQFNESLNWDKMTAEQKYNAELAMAILQNGQMPSDEILAAAGLSAEDAQKLMAQVTTTGGGGTGSGKKPTYYVDIAGNYYTTDKNGNYIPVSAGDVDPNGREDTSKMLDITTKNLANTWTAASQAQADKKAQEKAEQAKQQKAADQASKENQEKLRKILSGYKGFTNPWG